MLGLVPFQILILVVGNSRHNNKAHLKTLKIEGNFIERIADGLQSLNRWYWGVLKLII